jgi:putative endonuclease
MSKNKKIGNLGEEFAKDFYLKKGYDFIDKNWQKKYGEIDLICQKDNEIVFVEVKTRTSLAFGYGEEAVTFSKKNKISKTIEQFLYENEQFKDCFPRFDILTVEIFGLVPKFIQLENVCLR